MLQIEEKIAEKSLERLGTIGVGFRKIPTKALYRLQVSVTQEVQSWARDDATELEVTKDVKEMLQLTIEQVNMEKQEEKQCMDNLEKKLQEVFKTFPDNTQGSREQRRRTYTDHHTDNRGVQAGDRGTKGKNYTYNPS
jgi:hypothetical protein